MSMESIELNSLHISTIKHIEVLNPYGGFRVLHSHTYIYDRYILKSLSQFVGVSQMSPQLLIR